MKILVRYSLLVFALISFVQISAQETDYLDIKLDETKKRKSSFKRELVEIADNTFKAIIRTREEFVKAEGIYIFIDEKFMEHGEFVFYHSNGKVESRGMYNYGLKIGGWERYTTSGQRKADRYYNPETVEVIRDAMTE
jgi:antitoxin component YwqK of YwqJK toxin-antitoxin module